jgi:hypothetical protein
VLQRVKSPELSCQLPKRLQPRSLALVMLIQARLRPSPPTATPAGNVPPTGAGEPNDAVEGPATDEAAPAFPADLLDALSPDDPDHDMLFRPRPKSNEPSTVKGLKACMLPTDGLMMFHQMSGTDQTHTINSTSVYLDVVDGGDSGPALGCKVKQAYGAG